MKLTTAQKQALAMIQANNGRCLVFAKKSASGIGAAAAKALFDAGLITFSTSSYTNPQTGREISFKHANLVTHQRAQGDTTATADQIAQLRRHAVNAVTREIMAHGIELTWEQADGLGDETIAWMGGVLGLNKRTTDKGITFAPPKSYTGAESRRLGIETHEEE
jgi:hypothetical protein